MCEREVQDEARQVMALVGRGGEERSVRTLGAIAMPQVFTPWNGESMEYFVRRGAIWVIASNSE